MSVKSVCVRVCGVYAMKIMKCWTTPALMHVTEHTRLLNNEHAGNLYHYLFYTARAAIAVKKSQQLPQPLRLIWQSLRLEFLTHQTSFTALVIHITDC